MLVSRACWHFDAFAYGTPDTVTGHYHIRIEERRGGNQLLRDNWYIVTPLGVYPCEPPSGVVEFNLASVRFSAATRESLNAVHWRYIVPWSQRVPVWAKSRSVLCHYVRQYDGDAMEGIENYFHNAG